MTATEMINLGRIYGKKVEPRGKITAAHLAQYLEDLMEGNDEEKSSLEYIPINWTPRTCLCLTAG